MPILPAQCRAARGLLGWSQDELTVAVGSSVSKRTIVRFERGETNPHPRTLEAIRFALEAAGIDFLSAGPYQGDGGPGVRLKDQA